MNDFEDLLREELRRREPPAGFAERVMARVPQRRASFWTAYWRPLTAIAAVLVVAFSLGVFAYQRQVERAQKAEAANRQLMFALKLAAEKIQRVQQRVQNSSATVKVDREEVKGEL